MTFSWINGYNSLATILIYYRFTSFTSSPFYFLIFILNNVQLFTLSAAHAIIIQMKENYLRGNMKLFLIKQSSSSTTVFYELISYTIKFVSSKK